MEWVIFAAAAFVVLTEYTHFVRKRARREFIDFAEQLVELLPPQVLADLAAEEP